MHDLVKRLLEELGEDPSREGLVKTPKRVDKALTEADVPADASLVVLHVSAGNPFRRWPLDHFAATAASLVAQLGCGSFIVRHGAMRMSQISLVMVATGTALMALGTPLALLLSAFICGAGMAAHLAGAVAANTTLPVVGVPLSGGALNGVDALYATVQMPRGIPVATVAVDGSMNAALLVVQMLAIADADLAQKLAAHRTEIAQG